MYILAQNPVYNISSHLAKQGFGVVDDMGNVCDAARHYRSNKDLTLDDILVERFLNTREWEKLDGRYFYGGILYPHFGHFLTESVHRLRQYCGNQDAYDGIIFLKSPFKGTFCYDPLSFDFIKETLVEYLRVDFSKIFLCDKDTYVEYLEVHQQDYQLGMPISKEYLKFLGSIEEQYKDKSENVHGGGSLFVSRKHYLMAGRTLGMDAVEDVYEKNGFEIYIPENHAFRDQVLKIQSASKIVFEAGSAIHIFDIFGFRNQEITVFSRRGFDKKYWGALYRDRCHSFSIFDVVLPIYQYLGVAPGIGCSLFHVDNLIGFMCAQGLDFDQVKFVAALRGAVNKDFEELGYAGIRKI